MKIKTTIAAMAASAAIFVAQNPASAAPGGQASINLQNFDVALCYHNETSWSLSKDGSIDYTAPGSGVGTVTWLITATRGATGGNKLLVYGYLTINNAGTAPATIGNIVVNLQKKAFNCPGFSSGNTWVSAAADVSTANVGDAATTANIAYDGGTGSTSEILAANNGCGANNYSLGANTGPDSDWATFTETAGSGSLQFFHPDDNSIWALTNPADRDIAVGAGVSLVYKAEFDADLLGLVAGQAIRIETLVTFGNAGARGGSGATSTDVDINGIPGLQADEAYVRTVPTRISLDMPGLDKCNDTTHLTDTSDYIEFNTLTANGTASEDTTTHPGHYYSGDIDVFDSHTMNAIITLDVRGGQNGGDVCNTAHLDGDSDVVHLNTPSGPISEPCCTGIALTAQNCQTVDPEPAQSCPVCGLGECGFTQGGWGAKPNGNNPAMLLKNNFMTVYPTGSLTVGVGNTMTFANGTFSTTKKVKGVLTTTTVNVYAWEAIENYLPAGKTAGQLTASLLNPDKTSAGVFGGQVLALRLNVDFSGPVTQSGLGGVHLCGADFPSSVQGLTISQLLTKAEAVLGGATPASQGLYAVDNTTPMTVSQVNDIVDLLNNAFDNCATSDWASHHLCP